MKTLQIRAQRRSLLVNQLELTGHISTASAALSCGVSKDTIRRDLIALERKHALKRVSGGAILCEHNTVRFAQREQQLTPWLTMCPKDMQRLLADVHTLYLDGGTSVLAFARHLPHHFSGLVITPAPAVACALLALEIETFLIGGAIRPLGAIATGPSAESSIEKCRADICILGACALDAQFGLTADDPCEAAIKQTMSANATTTVVLAQSSKLQRKARYSVIECPAIDYLVTDTSSAALSEFTGQGIKIMTCPAPSEHIL